MIATPLGTASNSANSCDSAVKCCGSLIRRTILGGAQPGPHLLILGGVHGDEYEAMITLRDLGTRLGDQVLHGTVTLMPIVNASAYERDDRVGEDKRDLARTCPGRPDGSLTERVAYEVSAAIAEADFLIDLHSGGRAMWVQPLVGYSLHPDIAVLAWQRRMARAFNLPIVWGTSSTLDGRTLSVARDEAVPAIYAEWRGGGQLDTAGVKAYTEGCLNVMAELGMIDHEQPSLQIDYVIEDARAGSGHLQVNYNSPLAGLFETQRSLGECIAVGDILGRVSSPDGERIEEVVSLQDGLLLCLRALPHVAQGDCLGVILELNGAEIK